MAANKTKFTKILIIILLAIIAGQYFWPDKPIDESKYIKIGGKRYKVLSESTKITYVPVKTISPSYVPMPITVTSPVKPFYPTVIDTAAVVRAYYTKNYYIDTQNIDTIGTVKIKDTIFENRISSRILEFDYKLPVTTTTIITERPPVTKVYFGGGLNFNKVDFISGGYAGFLIQSKKDKLYGLNAGAINSGNEIVPYVGGSLYWKIKLRKNK